MNVAGTITNLQTLFWLDNEVLQKQAWNEQRPGHKGRKTKDVVQPNSSTARGSKNEGGWVQCPQPSLYIPSWKLQSKNRRLITEESSHGFSCTNYIQRTAYTHISFITCLLADLDLFQVKNTC